MLISQRNGPYTLRTNMRKQFLYERMKLNSGESWCARPTRAANNAGQRAKVTGDRWDLRTGWPRVRTAWHRSDSSPADHTESDGLHRAAWQRVTGCRRRPPGIAAQPAPRRAGAPRAG